MNVVDSSGWIEFLTAGPNGPAFKAVIQETGALIVPVIVIFEVFRSCEKTQLPKPPLKRPLVIMLALYKFFAA